MCAHCSSTPDLAVRVRDRTQAELVLRLAGERALRVELVSARDATRAVGVGYLAALQAHLRTTITVDCGERAGDALAALRTGLTRLVFTGRADQLERLRSISTQLGAVVLSAPPARALELRDREPEHVLAARIYSVAAGKGDDAPPARLGRTGAEVYEGAGKTLSDPGRREGGAAAMRVSEQVKTILSWYEGDNPGVKTNMARLLMHGRLAGTGKLVMLPVDQGFEHGPARSFASNPAAYDPHYLYQLAIEAGLSAYAAPLGPLEQGAATYAGEIPLILKLNSANSLAGSHVQDQAVTATVADALRIGCVGVGFTIYPGSDDCYDMQEELREIIREAKSKGLMAVVWSYPRGGKITKDGETALDVVAYAAHMAALQGANIIKVKPPKDLIDLDAAKKAYDKAEVPMESMEQRIRHVMQAAFNGKRVVVFSGGEASGTEGLLEIIKEIRDGGGNGSIIGRNSFQRSKSDALDLLDQVVKIYLGQA